MTNVPQGDGSRPRRRWLATIVVVVVAAVLVALAWPRRAEPAYQGIGLDAWLDQAIPAAVIENTQHESLTKALPALGTNAVPGILRRWTHDQSVWGRLEMIGLQLRAAVGKNDRPTIPFLDTLSAANLVVACGPAACLQVAEGIDGPDPRRRELAAWVLRSGSDGLGDADRVRLAVRAVRGQDRMASESAMVMLGGMETRAAGAVPALVELLPPGHGNLAEVPEWLPAFTLGRIGPDARAALPGLRALLASRDRVTRLSAGCALWSIGRDTAAVVPWLEKEIPGLGPGGLQASAEPEQTTARILDLVVAMGTDARPVAPLLEAMARDAKQPALREKCLKAARAADPGGAGAGETKP